MTCFFSGTDTAELHDNAPHHAYYLSLIVNYKSITDWCAKIAVCGEEETTGETVTTTRWQGAHEKIEKTKVNKVSDKKELLYILDCTLETERSLEVNDDLSERIKFIVDKKATERAAAVKHTPYMGYTKPAYTGTGNYQKTTGNRVAGLFDEEEDIMIDASDDLDGFWANWNRKSDKDKSFGSATNSRVSPKFSPKNVEDTLIQAITGDLKSNLSLGAAMMSIYPECKTEEDKFFETVTSSLDKLMITELKALDKIDRHCVVVAMYDLLSPYQGFSSFLYVDDVLVEYLLDTGKYSPLYVKSVTGIDEELQTTLEQTTIV